MPWNFIFPFWKEKMIYIYFKISWESFCIVQVLIIAWSPNLNSGCSLAPWRGSELWGHRRRMDFVCIFARNSLLTFYYTQESLILEATVLRLNTKIYWVLLQLLGYKKGMGGKDVSLFRSFTRFSRLCFEVICKGDEKIP